MSEAEQTLPNPNMEGPPADSGREVRIDPESLAKHYEADDVRPRPIIWFTIGVLIMIALGLLVMWWFVNRWTGEALDVQVQVPSADVMPPSVPGPGLQAAPEIDMSLLLARENARLSGYRWVDRENGVVQIPIERAMELIVEVGPPAVEGEVPDFGVDPAHQLDSTGGWGIVLEEIENDGVIDSEAIDENTPGNEIDGAPDAGILDNEVGDGEVIDSEATDENAPGSESEGGSPGSEVIGDE